MRILVPYSHNRETDPELAYYLAYNPRTKENEYVIRPDAIADFAANAEYARSFAAVYTPRGDMEIESARAGYAAMRGDFGGYFGALGKSWLAAFRDPGFYLNVGLSVTGGMLARGAVANPVDDIAAQSLKGKYANRTGVSYRAADDVNAEFGGYMPPYQQGTRVTEYTTVYDDQFVRVHGENNAARSWMMRREAIQGLSPEEIARKYSLPEVPTYISDVNVPAGTRVRTGRVADNFSGNQGAVQYQWLGRIPESAITNTRSLR